MPLPTRTWLIDRVVQQASPPDPEYPSERRDTVSITTARTIDVDGDGVLDALVPEPAKTDCNHDAHHGLYIMRGECGHRVGTVIGWFSAQPIRGPRVAGELPELTTIVQSGHQPDPRVPAELRTDERTYRFDGAEYREVAHKVDAAICHHCGLVRCTLSPQK